MRNATTIIVIFFIYAVVTVSAQTIRHVPSQYKTIQAAIDVANHGDTVIVAPDLANNGSYLENIEFIGKAITVKSSGGPLVTTIDGSRNVGRRGSVVTFQNGEGLKSLLDGFTITNGTGRPIAVGTIGGGIYCGKKCSPTIQNNIITRNSAGGGGGIFCTNEQGTGATTPLIVSNIITYNTAGDTGGGIRSQHGANPIIINCIIARNSAVTGGGALGCEYSSHPKLTNCTISANTSSNGAGGIDVATASITVTNIVLWDNGNEIDLRKGSTGSVTYSDIKGGWPGQGNINADPLFVDPGKGNYHIQSNSPCIDKGTNSAMNLPATDIDGEPRIGTRITDIGADEIVPPNFWTNLSPTGGQLPARSEASTVYDCSNNQLILFGGWDNSRTYFNDLWFMTNANGQGPSYWSNAAPQGTQPSGREGHTAVYDARSNNMIIWAGEEMSPGRCASASDIWILRNANGIGGTLNWKRVSLKNPIPPARSQHSAIYDSISNRMVVFAGNSCSSQILNDVWVLTNANGIGTPSWIKLSPSGSAPTALNGHSAIYDQTSNRMTVFGGSMGLSGSVNKTWVLTNANGLGGQPTWIELKPTGVIPSKRHNHSAVYDSTTNMMTIYGGVVGNTQYNDMWVLTNSNGLGWPPTWIQISVSPSPSHPMHRAAHSAVYDSQTHIMMLFGGFKGLRPGGTPYNDVWTISPVNGAIGPIIYGKGTPGGGNKTPNISVSGFPSIRNPNFQIRLRDAKPDSIAFFSISPPPLLRSIVSGLEFNTAPGIAPIASIAGDYKYPLTLLLNKEPISASLFMMGWPVQVDTKGNANIMPSNITSLPPGVPLYCQFFCLDDTVTWITLKINDLATIAGFVAPFFLKVGSPPLIIINLKSAFPSSWLNNIVPFSSTPGMIVTVNT